MFWLVVVILSLAQFASSLRFEHKSFSLKTWNRVCGLREFSKGENTEYLDTILGKWQVGFWKRSDDYLWAGAEFSKSYYQDHPHAMKLNWRFGEFEWHSVTRDKLIETTSWYANHKWLKITDDMPDCVDYNIDIQTGDKFPLEEKEENNLQITDELSDAQIYFKDVDGFQTRNYPVSKYVLSTKSEYFHKLFTGGFCESSNGKDDPIEIICRKASEEITEELMSCLHQNKFKSQESTSSMQTYLVNMSTEQLINLLELSHQLQIECIKTPGVYALTYKIDRTIETLEELELVIDYGKKFDDGSSDLLLNALLLRKKLKEK